MSKTLAALSGAAILGVCTSLAFAAPLQPTAPADAGVSLVEKVHECHGSANPKRDGYGWHYHAERCRRVDIPPPRGYDRSYRSYDYDDDYRYRRRDRGPRCWQDCNYVGPVRICKTRCR